MTMIPTAQLRPDTFPEPDPGVRVVAVPSDFAAALEAAPDALHYFESLPYGRQRRFVRNVDAATSAAGRRRRIARTIERLRAEGAVLAV
jgi:uncharacterized protein YdeI (YjbR/CyaY-like superfamily)